VPRQRKILLLEDDPLFLDHLEILLKDTPYLITKCCTIEEGLEHIDNENFDCGILDFNLPDGNSIDIIQALQKKDTAALVVTGRNEQEIIKAVFQGGGHDYIEKTEITPDNLTNGIRKAIAHTDLLKELQATRVELENFVRTAAHDLKTPLSTLNGHLFLLQMAIDDNEKEDIRLSMQEIEQAGQDMANLIDVLLEYTRVGWTFRPVPVDLDTVFEVVLKRADILIKETEATIQTSPSPLPIVLGDKDLLGQLFQNLISNAIKYRSEESPRIELSVEVNPESPGKAHISVKDNGMGIDPSLHEKIFQPLERGKVTDQEGHGIGLATCRRIAEKHGGDIWVESEGTKGSTFHFTINLEQYEDKDQEE